MRQLIEILLILLMLSLAGCTSTEYFILSDKIEQNAGRIIILEKRVDSLQKAFNENKYAPVFKF